MKFRNWIILENKQEYINQSKNILKKLGIHEVDSAVQEIEQFVKSLDCSNKRRFIPITALFYNNKPLIFGVIKRLSEIINNNKKIDVRYDKNKQEYYVFVHSTQEYFYNKDFIKFMEWVDGEYYTKEYEKLYKQAKSEDTDFSDMKKVASSNNIDIYEARNVFDAIKLGRGYSFCISQPGANNAYYTYRMHGETTFYFVFDRNRDRSDPLHVVVVGVSKKNHDDYYDDDYYDDDDDDYYDDNDNDRKYVIELTDAQNTTGIIDHPYQPGKRGQYNKKYFNYLRENGIDTSIFKHKPLTDEEREEYEIIGEKKESLQEFKDLPIKYKIKYIQLLHELTPEQLEYIIEEAIKGKSSFVFMLEFYLGVVYKIPDYILYKLYDLIYKQKKGKRQWLKTYLRRREGSHIRDHDWVEVFLLDKFYGKKVLTYEYADSIERTSPQLENTPEFKEYIENYAIPVIFNDGITISCLDEKLIIKILRLDIDKKEMIYGTISQWYTHGNPIISSGIKYLLEYLFKNNFEELNRCIDDFFSSILTDSNYKHIAERYAELIGNALLKPGLIKYIGKMINKHIDQRKAIQSDTAVFPIDLMIRTEKFDLFDVIPAFLPENKRDIDHLDYSVPIWANYIHKKQEYYRKRYGKERNIQLEDSSRVNHLIKNCDKIFDKNINTWSEMLRAISQDADIKMALVDFHEAYLSTHVIYKEKIHLLKQRLTELFRQENNPHIIKSHILFIIGHFYKKNKNLSIINNSCLSFVDYLYVMKEVYPNIIFENKEINESFVILVLDILHNQEKLMDSQLGKWLLDRTDDNVLIYDIGAFKEIVIRFDNYMEYAKKILHTFETGTGAKFIKKYYPDENKFKEEFLTFISRLFVEENYTTHAQRILDYFFEEMPIGKTHMWVIDSVPKNYVSPLNAAENGALMRSMKLILSDRGLSYFFSRGKYKEWDNLYQRLKRVCPLSDDVIKMMDKYDKIKQKINNNI